MLLAPPPVVSEIAPAGAQATDPPVRVQYGALPFREDEDGELRVLLVTSRETRRWILPKGWPERKIAPHLLAAKEAYEEAGVRGVAATEPIGSYRYGKRMADGSVVPCEVQVYPIQVVRMRKSWPERKERERIWVTLAEAAMMVEEPGLVSLLLSLQE